MFDYDSDGIQGVKFMKKIWIDLDNSPHVPFFKPIIAELKKRNYSVVLTARKCSQVCELANYWGLQYKQIGRHYGKNKILKVVGLLIRSLQLVQVVFKEKPDLSVSHGSRAQILISALTRVPNILIFDYEFVKWPPFVRPLGVIIPEVVRNSFSNKHSFMILTYPGIKENVYTSSLIEDSSIITQLGIKTQNMIVTIRPPASDAHYHNSESDILFAAVIDFLSCKPDLSIILLPRNPKQEKFVRQKWPVLFKNRKIIIPQKVVDGLNLIWQSDLVISGGGTMNREAAALGVPVYSIFRGKIGAIDKYLADSGSLELLETVDDVNKIRLSRRQKLMKPASNHRITLNAIVDEIVKMVK